MPIGFVDNTRADSLATHFRRRRFDFFWSLVARLERPVRILDVGGTEAFWRMMGIGVLDGVAVTLLNNCAAPPGLTSIEYVQGDGRRMMFGDKCFDVVFSNSVLEHVGNLHEQRQMAQEIRRVGRRYFVQTPNKHFPVEPHFVVPLFQFLPIRVRALLVQSLPLGWFPRTPDSRLAMALVESVRLLTRAELMQLFPECSLWEEKLLGMTKSFVAYAGWNVHSPPSGTDHMSAA